MTTFDTARWYRHPGHRQVRSLVTEPDVDGVVCVVLLDGRYTTVLASYLTPIPERHAVERRVPKAGDRYIGYYGDIITASHDSSIERWVVVDDEFDPAAELEAYRAWRKNEETS